MCGGTGLARQPRSISNLLRERRAKCMARSRCWWASTCTAKGAPIPNASAEELDWAKHHNSKGGSRDTDVNELAVTPNGSPLGRIAVTTVTPVANRPKASRSSRCESEVVTTVSDATAVLTLLWPDVAHA